MLDPSNGPLQRTSTFDTNRDVGAGRALCSARAVGGFAAAVDGRALHEERWELLREAKFSLGEWEAHRRPEDRERLIASLEGLARLVRAA